MSGGFYHLYLDESKYSKDGSVVYGIAGVAIEEGALRAVRTTLGGLKKHLWSSMSPSQAKSIVLHASDIRGANIKYETHYDIFRKKENIRKVFSGVADIILKNDLTVFGAIVDLTKLKNEYLAEHSYYTGDRICLTEVVNNFVCFLKWNKAKGRIIFESRSDRNGNKADRKLKKQFYKIYSQGTDIYSALELQECLLGFKFIKKQENEAGLQIADFVPTPFMINFSNQSQPTINIWKTLKKHRYSGGKTKGNIQSSKFGVKYI
ncbi:DUF3800 domain-containing protein [Streptococcus suis]|uniref:DUF3800 domain-containing protein n=1 Tax=Streptococcus suis TaxID=1307 RepID=UPI00195F6479|nr:DUF3800 domain-containing protein [Streptococcus suis]MCL4881201.1 DUF3800 domain-containing protein [Streptococcus suis]